MKTILVFILFLLPKQYVTCDVVLDNLIYLNRTTPADRQLYDFKLEHPEPVGVLTTSSGLPVDLRDTLSINRNQFINAYHVDLLKHFVQNRIPENIVHAKGTGAYGYFIVDNDVTKYTSADVFNEVGKITPVYGRFSVGLPHIDGPDVERDIKALAIKLFTQEGNLDFVGINLPVFFFRNAIDFAGFTASSQKNHKTHLSDFTARWDFITKKPEVLPALFWLLSDYGIPNGYRKMDYFPIHVYELLNKRGERHFVKFNIRSEQGLENLDASDATILAGREPDYYARDLYNAIEEKDYPVFRLEMFVMSYKDILQLNYDPFDVTRLWQKGTYDIINVGRFIFNQNLDNLYRHVTLSAFNPGNLVPGIPGPIDSLFRARAVSYRDAQIYRLGINYNRIPVNIPLYRKGYNRDGKPPVRENMKDAPTYFPNSFNGPVPYVDVNRPKDSLNILHTSAVDLEEPANFYNNILTDDQKDRFINNTIRSLLPVAPYLQERAIRLYTLVDALLGKKLAIRLKETEKHPGNPSPRIYKASRKTHFFLNSNEYHKYNDIDQCIEC